MSVASVGLSLPFRWCLALTKGKEERLFKHQCHRTDTQGRTNLDLQESAQGVIGKPVQATLMSCSSMNVCRNPRLQPLPQMRVQARLDCSLIAEQYCLVLLCTPLFGYQQGIMPVKASVQVQINSQSSRVNHIYHWICMCHWRKGGTFRVLPFGMLVPGFGSGQLGDLCRNTGAMAHPNRKVFNRLFHGRYTSTD